MADLADHVACWGWTVHGGPGRGAWSIGPWWTGPVRGGGGRPCRGGALWPAPVSSPRRRDGARELVPRARACSVGFGEADARDGCVEKGPGRTGPRGGGGSTTARTPARPCGAKGGRKRDLRAPTHTSWTSEARGRLTLARTAAERDASRRPRSSTDQRRRYVLRGCFGGSGLRLGFVGARAAVIGRFL